MPTHIACDPTIRRSLAGARAYEGASEEGSAVGRLDGSGVGLAQSDDVIHAVVPEAPIEVVPWCPLNKSVPW